MSAESIEHLDWTGQARTLAAQSPPGNGFRYATFRVELTLTAEQEVHRTRVFDNQKPRLEPGKWSGWQEDRLAQFIMKQAGIKRPLPAPVHLTNENENELETVETPTKIVHIHDDWGIQVKWALEEGQQLPPNTQWAISVYLESIGKKAKEYDLPVANAQKNATSVLVEPDPTERIAPGV